MSISSALRTPIVEATALSHATLSGRLQIIDAKDIYVVYVAGGLELSSPKLPFTLCCKAWSGVGSKMGYCYEFSMKVKEHLQNAVYSCNQAGRNSMMYGRGEGFAVKQQNLTNDDVAVSVAVQCESDGAVWQLDFMFGADCRATISGPAVKQF